MPIPDPITPATHGFAHIAVVDKATGKTIEHVVEASQSGGYVVAWQTEGEPPVRRKVAVEFKVRRDAPRDLRESWGLVKPAGGKPPPPGRAHGVA